jgi:hypothetical protein
LADRWSQVSPRLSALSPAAVGASVGLAGAALVCTLMSWRCLLADLGSPLPLRPGARVFFLSALGKYVPGSVWPYLAQVEMGRKLGVPRARSAAVSMLTVAISLTTGLLLAAATLPETSTHASTRYWPAFLAVPALLGVLHPRILNRLMHRALVLLRRPAEGIALSWRGIAFSSLWSVLAWLFLGLHIWVLARAVASVGGTDVALCIGAYALAWAAGFLVVIAPAGAGVREAALTAALAAAITASSGLTVALVSRLVVTAGDLGAALLAALVGRAATEDRGGSETVAPPPPSVEDPYWQA